MNEQQLKFNKTRIAPTPSGYLHLGNVLSFALTAWLASQADAVILLRIDDMDRQRAQPAYIEDIFETLRFLNIPWHEGPRNYDEFEANWSQRQRLPQYEQQLQVLAAKGEVFACNCSRSQLSRDAAGAGYNGTCRHRNLPLAMTHVNWRLRTDEHACVTVNTPGGSVKTLLPDEMKDVVIRKKDGYPAYQLSSVVDDLLFGVDFIVRGVDLWSSTLVQLYLAERMGNNSFGESSFYHHKLLTDGGDSKLSKSAGATSVQYLRGQGNSAAAIYGMIGEMMGWNEGIGSWEQLGERYWHEEQSINLLEEKNI